MNGYGSRLRKLRDLFVPLGIFWGLVGCGGEGPPAGSSPQETLSQMQDRARNLANRVRGFWQLRRAHLSSLAPEPKLFELLHQKGLQIRVEGARLAHEGLRFSAIWPSSTPPCQMSWHQSVSYCCVPMRRITLTDPPEDIRETTPGCFEESGQSIRADLPASSPAQREEIFALFLRTWAAIFTSPPEAGFLDVDFWFTHEGSHLHWSGPYPIAAHPNAPEEWRNLTSELLWEEISGT